MLLELSSSMVINIMFLKNYHGNFTSLYNLLDVHYTCPKALVSGVWITSVVCNVYPIHFKL